MAKEFALGLWVKSKSFDIHYNNRGTIYITYNLVYHEQTKHIDIKYFFIQDVVVKKIATTKDTVSMMIKLVPLAKLKLYLSTIDICRE